MCYQKCTNWIVEKMFNSRAKQMEENKKLVAKKAQEHWGYPMAIDVLLKEKYDEAPKDPNNYNYIVFLDKEGDVDWEYCGIGSRGNLSAESMSVISKATAVEGMPCDILSRNERIAFKKMIAEVIVLSIEEKFNDGRELLKAARLYYYDRIVVQSRIWSTIALILIGIVMSVGLLWVGHFKLSTFSRIYLPMTFGLLGAIVGHFRSVAHAYADSDAGRLLRVLNVIGHLFCGVVFGLMGVVFFKSGFCPEGMRGLCNATEGCCVIAFTAGLFESFIPSLLSKFVSRTDKSEDAK